MKSIFESLDTLLKGVVVWLQALCTPAQSVYDSLKLQDPDKRLGNLVVIWIWSLALGIVLQSPVMKLFGIEITDIGFLLSYVLTTSLPMLIIGAAIHLALRLFRLASGFFDTFSIYVITVVVYSPVWTSMALPSLVNNMIIFRKLKALNLSFEDTISSYFTEVIQLSEYPSILMLIFSVALPISTLSVLWATAIFRECFVQVYHAPRFATSLAVMLGWVIGAVVVIVTVGPFNALLTWSYVK